MASRSDSETVELWNLTVSLTSLQLLWDLEHRHLTVEIRDDGRLWVAPGSALTPEDTAAIREHREELLQLVRYCEGIQFPAGHPTPGHCGPLSREGCDRDDDVPSMPSVR